MLAPADAPASQRVRCRQIVENDLDDLADLLTEGFPVHDKSYWQKGFARLAGLPQLEDLPRFGHVLESGESLAGVLLTISSRRGEQIFSNVSGWYVRPGYRAHSAMLVLTATKLKHVIYVNASPAPHTWRTLEATGWKPYNFGRSAVLPLLDFRGGRIRTAIPADLPEWTLLEDHRGWGCISVVCEKDNVLSPFVFRPRRIARSPLPLMELLYCRGTAEFERCGGALARYFLPRGYAGFLLDGKVATFAAHHVPGKEPRFYKGPRAPALNDLAYTEKVIFG